MADRRQAQAAGRGAGVLHRWRRDAQPGPPGRPDGQAMAAAVSGPCNPSTNRARALASLRRTVGALLRRGGPRICRHRRRDAVDRRRGALRSRRPATPFWPPVRRLRQCEAMTDGYAALIGAGGGPAERLHHRRHGGRGTSALCRWPLDPARRLGLGRGRSRQRRLDRPAPGCVTRWRRSTASCRGTACRPRSSPRSAARPRSRRAGCANLTPDRLGALTPVVLGEAERTATPRPLRSAIARVEPSGRARLAVLDSAAVPLYAAGGSRGCACVRCLADAIGRAGSGPARTTR